MKNNVILAVFALVLVLSPLASNKALALSCLSVEMYLKDIVGKEEVLVFTGTSVDKIDKDKYTAEVIEVDEALQGYIESEVFVYHQKDETWGYLCNFGPKEEGSMGLYVAQRNDFGKYSVNQRLELNDPLVKTLRADLKAKGMEGGKGELSRTDRMNQIVDTVLGLIEEVRILVAEHMYWKNN